MSKRKLTRQQKWRIEKKQEAYLNRAEKSALQSSIHPEKELSDEFEGLVIAHYGQQIEVEGTGGATGWVRRCYTRTNLGPLVTGDRVIWRAGQDDTGVVVALQARGSLLSRPDKFGALKPVAANIDVLCIVFAPVPEPHPNLIDRYLVAAELSGIEPALVMNKCELLDPDGLLPDMLDAYENLGYRCLRVSARQRGRTLDELRRFLVGQTSVLVGQSGVGKSSLIQALLPEASLKVGGLSDGVGKGTHTTTTARLYHLPEGGDLVDSPGIREFGLWHIEPQQLLEGFREFRRFRGHCRFRDCHHFRDPGCALAQAVAAGDISESRRDSFLAIRDSLDEISMNES